MVGERAESMARLGDTYAALAENPDRPRPGVVSTVRFVHPECPRCGKKMRLSHSLPPTATMSIIQAFGCGGCGETMIWKGK